MSTPSLHPVRLRMERASEHADNLRREMADFLETNPYELVHEFDAKARPNEFPPGPPIIGIHRYRVKTLRPVPDRISILAGDVLKDLRSALDYLAWQLGLAQSDSPPSTTAFPIFGKAKDYRTDHMRFIGGIDVATHATFESIQPYHAGDKAFDHPLWVLHRMANDDKHKIPHVVGGLPTAVGVERASPEVDLFLLSRYGAFDDGEEIAAVGYYAGIEPETQPNLKIAFGIAFGKDTPAKGRPLWAEIDRIGVEVDRVIGLFEPFFPA